MPCFCLAKHQKQTKGLVSQSQKLCLLTFPETVSGVRDGLKILKLEPSAPRILVISICNPCLVVVTPRKMPKTSISNSGKISMFFSLSFGHPLFVYSSMGQMFPRVNPVG